MSQASYLAPPVVRQIDAPGGAFESYADLISLHIEASHHEYFEGLADLCREEVPRLHRLSRKTERGVSRNDPCPCGSGRKFKNCHYGSRIK